MNHTGAQFGFCCQEVEWSEAEGLGGVCEVGVRLLGPRASSTASVCIRAGSGVVDDESWLGPSLSPYLLPLLWWVISGGC